MHHRRTNTTRATRTRNQPFGSALLGTAIAFVSALGWAAMLLLASGATLGLGLAASAFGWWLGTNYPM